MKRFIICLFLMFFLPLSIFAAPSKESSPVKIKHVIYITFDGTRWQDIFLDHSHLEKFWKNHAQKGLFYGEPNSNRDIRVTTVPISLPSYQSQMAGKVQPCLGNLCGRIRVETLPESLKRKLDLQKKDIAVFGSWYEIAYAAEHIEGSVYTNTGNNPVYDPETQSPDAIMYDLNLKQAADFPGGNIRYDKYTFAQAMHYFEVYLPRFMWIALNDADEAAHRGDLIYYHAALSFYDNVLDEVITKLQLLNIDKESMVIVTTDHGRGNDENWKHHGIGFPESRQTWAFVMNGDLKATWHRADKFQYSTLSIRPTVELALGVE